MLSVESMSQHLTEEVLNQIEHEELIEACALSLHANLRLKTKILSDSELL